MRKKLRTLQNGATLKTSFTLRKSHSALSNNSEASVTLQVFHHQLSTELSLTKTRIFHLINHELKLVNKLSPLRYLSQSKSDASATILWQPLAELLPAQLRYNVPLLCLHYGRNSTESRWYRVHLNLNQIQSQITIYNQRHCWVGFWRSDIGII